MLYQSSTSPPTSTTAFDVKIGDYVDITSGPNSETEGTYRIRQVRSWAYGHNWQSLKLLPLNDFSVRFSCVTHMKNYRLNLSLESQKLFLAIFAFP